MLQFYLFALRADDHQQEMGVRGLWRALSHRGLLEVGARRGETPGCDVTDSILLIAMPTMLSDA